jgi:putative oxidoreductase
MSARSAIRSLISSEPNQSWRFTILIRLMVGWVFLLAGLQKLINPTEMGEGRFAEIGIPAPEFFGPFVGFVEAIGGALLIIGLFVRLASVPLIFVMIFALGITKVPELWADGVVAALHAARLDVSMTLGLIYLLFAGSGAYSTDRALERRLV